MKQEWIIIVAQEVRGKSKFPHPKVGKFARYKPWPYKDSNQPHRIIYARSFLASETEALAKAAQVEHEMFLTYVMGMGDLSVVCVSEITTVLHNITTNTSKQMSTTYRDDESENPAFLFPGVVCSNANLGKWKIVKGL